jgi:hypothetical protein
MPARLSFLTPHLHNLKYQRKQGVGDAMTLDEFRQVKERGPLHLLHIGQQAAAAAAASALAASGGAWPGANGGGGRKRQQKPKAPVNVRTWVV